MEGTATFEGDMVVRLRSRARLLIATSVLGVAAVGGVALAPASAAQAEASSVEWQTDVTIPLPDDPTPARSRAARVQTPESGVQAASVCEPDIWGDPWNGPLFDVAVATLSFDCDEGLWVAGIGVSAGTPHSIRFAIDVDGWVDGNGCEGGDFTAVAEWNAGIADFVAAVFRTPNCRTETWTFMGDAYFDVYSGSGRTYYEIAFVRGQIGSAPVVSWSGTAWSVGGHGSDRFPDVGTLTAWRPDPTFPPAVVAPAGGARPAESHSIFRLYSAYLLRQPDAPGLAYWEDQYLTCGQSLAGVSAFFAGSSEFTTRYGTVTDAEFVDLIYTNVLGRTADEDGLAYWVRRLADGTADRGQVMLGFSEAPEYWDRTGTSPPTSPGCHSRSVTDSVYRLYRAYFLREPDAEGEWYWIAPYAGCALSLAAISDLFAGSAEFLARYGSLSDRAFVELVYLNVLGRPGEASGIDYWSGLLASRAITRGGMMIGFSDSSEFVGRTGTRTPVRPC
jgi:hypothetical protein